MSLHHDEATVFGEKLDDRDAPQYGHATDVLYVKVAAVLVVLTALEVWASYAHWLGHATLAVLLTLMAIKFTLVVLFFMHLKWDSKLFGRLFWAGVFLALAVYVVALSTFKFFAKS